MRLMDDGRREIVEMEILDGLNNVDIMDRIGEDILAIARIRHGVEGNGLKIYRTEKDYQECKVRDDREFEEMVTLACDLFDKDNSIDYVMQRTNLSEMMILLILEELVFSDISEEYELNCADSSTIDWREMMTNKFILREYSKPKYKLVEELTPEIIEERKVTMKMVQEAEETLVCINDVINKSIESGGRIRLFNDISPLTEACEFLNVPIEYLDNIRKEDYELWNSVFYRDEVDPAGEFVAPITPKPRITYETIVNDKGVPTEVVMKVDGKEVNRGVVTWKGQAPKENI